MKWLVIEPVLLSSIHFIFGSLFIQSLVNAVGFQLLYLD